MCTQGTKTFYALVVSPVVKTSRCQGNTRYNKKQRKTHTLCTTGTAACLFPFSFHKQARKKKTKQGRAEMVQRTSALAEGSQCTEVLDPGEHRYTADTPGGWQVLFILSFPYPPLFSFSLAGAIKTVAEGYIFNSFGSWFPLFSSRRRRPFDLN